jgi:hypothetical protein
MSWPGRLESVREVEIETRGAQTDPGRRTTIWVVVEDGEAYVRSYRGAAGRWYRELAANPLAVLHADGESIAVRALPAPDAESVERASAGYRRKYAGDPDLASMLRDEILPTTLRLEPR